MFGLSALNTVLILWGVVTGILAILLIYRSTISMKEDDQLFLDPSQSNLEKEQQEVRKRLDRITPYTAILGVTSGVLLIASAGFWVYEQFTKQGY
ncbi:MAG: hypothetical protein JO336_17275 [Acidobacteriia bacterium]|nr:hypothetical protein [Terriglobia bacterium]MBV8905539.1 hypothetical protein [Terriglobia bacterium]MBV9742708.1 hypothetical protein [Terriglobia bacterium]